MPVIPRYTGDQEIESLPSKNEALSSNPVPPKKKKKWSGVYPVQRTDTMQKHMEVQQPLNLPPKLIKINQQDKLQKIDGTLQN
jgi:hypothetical protein